MNDKIKHCKCCGNEIETARLNATKGQAITCIGCMKSNDVSRIAGFPIISGKDTYSELNLVDQQTAQELANIQERRGYGVGMGMKGLNA